MAPHTPSMCPAAVLHYMHRRCQTDQTELHAARREALALCTQVAPRLSLTLSGTALTRAEESRWRWCVRGGPGSGRQWRRP
jgi:hypothetical protein